MPIYEYRCENCHETFEVLQKFSDEPLTECILCAEGPVKKLMSASAFILKGAGFYVNDYKKKETASEKKDESSSSTPSSTTPSSTTTSPATTSPATSSSESKPSKPASTETAKAA